MTPLTERPKWPFPPEPAPGPWQTRQFGPLTVRYRRKDRFEVERRRLRRAWAVLAEHVTRDLRLRQIVDWLAERLER